MKLEKRLEKVKADAKESNSLFMFPALFIFGIIFVIGILGIPLDSVPVALSMTTMLGLVGLIWGLLVSMIKSECKSKIEFYEELLDDLEENQKNNN